MASGELLRRSASFDPLTMRAGWSDTQILLLSVSKSCARRRTHDGRAGPAPSLSKLGASVVALLGPAPGLTSTKFALVAPGKQAAGEHMRLDLGGAFEDVEDACIAEHAADAIFHGIAVAAVDLQRIVGIGPGGARGEQLRHAGLDVAAPVAVLLARSEVGQLACDHGLHCHPGELAEDPREGIDRLAELLAVESVARGELW